MHHINIITYHDPFGIDAIHLIAIHLIGSNVVSIAAALPKQSP